MDVINSIAQPFQKRDVINTLIAEMTRVIVETKRFPAIKCFNRAFRRNDVKRNLGGMHLQSELDSDFVKYVKDRIPAVREVFKAGIDLPRVIRWERVEEMPDGAAGEAVNDVHAEFCGGAGRVFHLFRGAFLNAARFAVAPHIFRHDALVPGINVIADCLSDEVIAHRPDFEPIFGEQLVPTLAVSVLGECLVYLKMISPAGEF